MELRLFNGLRDWDRLSEADLRMVARAFVNAAKHPSYTVDGVCLNILLEVNGLEVMYSNLERDADGDPLSPVYYVRRKLPKRHWWQRQRYEELRLPLEDLQFFFRPKADGGGGAFDWLRSGSTRTKPPHVPKPSRGWRSLLTSFSAPKRYMSDWTWQQYRACTDYYEQYVKIKNAVLRARLSGAAPSSLAGAQGDRLLRDAQAQWLATIFCRRVWFRDADTFFPRYGFHYKPGQATANQRYFRSIDPVDMQLILFWWEGMQHYLQQRYRKCFKRSSGAPQRTDDPLGVYSRSMATLEKYTESDEESINRKTYTIILQHLDDMVRQNEEYEKMRSTTKK